MALRLPRQVEPDERRAPRARVRLHRLLIPVVGGLLAAVLIVVGTPHVAWFLRAVLALIAFAYVCGQSAAYLWTSDQG
jgi:hypothetical protein